MKKTLFALAALGAFSAAAQAQSSVALYGLIDAGVAYVNNSGGNSNWAAASGMVNGSRWGLEGSEDLGNGLKAIFKLENGFNIANGKLGQGGREFGRQAYVGLSSAQFGALTIGRQYDSVVDYLAPLTLNGSAYGGVMASHPYDNDNTNNSFRINNSVKYSSVNYNGLTFGALYGFSNKAGGFSDNRAYSFCTAYNNGPLSLAAAYLQINRGNGNLAGGALDSSASSGDAIFLASRQRVFGVGGSYAFGPATVGLVWTHTQLDNVASTNFNSTAIGGFNGQGVRFNNYEINAKYALTPAVSLAGAYTFTDGKLDATGQKPKWHTVTLQADYHLSKRTDVYLEGTYQKVADNEGTGLNAAINGAGGVSSTDSQVMVGTGIRHRF
ncbi:MAG: porin [Burkholderiales bacterium]|nr:porin [Burkholderiales bacterium]